MIKLVAKCDILYRGKYYLAGEMLPADDPKMVKAWVDCGSAEWVGKESTKPAGRGSKK